MKSLGQRLESLSRAANSTAAVTLYAVVALALVLRLPRFGRSLWYDELWSTHIKLYSAGELVRSVLHDVHPPLYSLLMFVWIRVFGDSEISIRVPALVLGLATIVLTHRIARRFGTGTAALVTACLLALSPVHIWYSQEARHYSAVLFLLLLTIEALYRLDELGRWRPWGVVYAVGLTAALFTHYYVIAFVPVFMLLSPKQHRKKLFLINVGAALLLVAFLAAKSRFGALATAAPYLRAFTVAEAAALYDWLLTGKALWVTPQWKMFPLNMVPWMIRAGFLVLLVTGVVTLWRRSGRRAFHVLLFFLALPAFLAFLTAVGFRNTYIERSALLVLPFFFLLVATGIDAARGRWRIPVAVLTATFAIGTLASYYLNADRWTVYKPTADWRSAAAYLRSARSADEPLIVFATVPVTVLNYYRLDASLREVGLDDVVGVPPAALTETRRDSWVARVKWRVNRLTAFGGPDNFPPSFLRGSRDEIILIGKRDDSIVIGVLCRAGVSRFFLVRDKFWSAGFPTVFAGVLENPRYRLAAFRNFQGAELSEYRTDGADCGLPPGRPQGEPGRAQSPATYTHARST